MHLWVRAEQRGDERRVGLVPDGVRTLLEAGMEVTVEDSARRIIPTAAFAEAGAEIAAEGAWSQAPADTVILGLKELPDDDTPLVHRHIMFGHAFKGQHSGARLLARFRAGGGALYDLEYLVDEEGRRVAAFGYWAGFVGAAVTVKAWCAQASGGICGAVDTWPDKEALLATLDNDLGERSRRPTAIIIGVLGRVGTGAADLCDLLDIQVTGWDMEETADGGPFPDILQHDLFLNCILARPGTPVFVPRSALAGERQLTAIGDIACDPDSDYNPVPLYDRPTSWSDPVVRVHEKPPLDLVAIDNLPSFLPLESSLDFAEQLLPSLLQLADMGSGVWSRAFEEFKKHGT